MDENFTAAIRFLDDIEDLNPNFEGYFFMKKYWLVNANREFFKRNFPELKLPREHKYLTPKELRPRYSELLNNIWSKPL